MSAVIQIRRRVDVHMAWQYKAGRRMPVWVAAVLSHHDPDGIVIERTNGRQLVRGGEWLFRATDDSEPQWMTDVEFQRDWVEILEPGR